MNLSGYYCVFSWENGSNKRYFQLSHDGSILDLFGSKGNDNERFWIQADDELHLLSSQRKITSKFPIKSNGEIEYFHSIGKVENKNIKLKLFFVKNQSDLFEAKTKFRHQDYIAKGYLEVGEHTYGGFTIVDAKYGKVSIGDYCSIASGVKFVIGNHRIDLVTTYPFETLKKFYNANIDITDHFCKGNIHVGNDVWIGNDVHIMSGVHIGDGAVIAANAVVTKNVEPYSIVGGNPAKHIKYRIENPAYRIQMQRIAWWHWSEEKITENIEWIMSPDIEAFIEKFK